MATAKEPAPVVRVLGRDRASARPIFSVALGGDDQAEITANWDRLVEDGIVSVPLARSVLGATFGSCIDRYGTAWLVTMSAPATA